VAQIVDHLFRRESGRLVAILSRRLGARHLHLAEDVVQDALLRAMEAWPFAGVPDNPSAWLLQTARNRAFDVLRRTGVWGKNSAALAPLIEECAQQALAAPPPQFEEEIADAQLRMMFVCCHPELPPDAQVALILKTLCGFGEREIAAAFLVGEAAVGKKLVRARKLLRGIGLSTELPVAAELSPRVESVLRALYLLFNEGYKASHGDTLLRADLCAEALRLAELLAAHPVGGRPETHALLALLHLHAARLSARLADDGSLLLLSAQDRTRWDKGQIARGIAHLEKSAAGEGVTRWHLEAGIAACHALAPSYQATDWTRILSLYDKIEALAPSPVVALNRAIAVAHMHGNDAGLQALEAIPDRRALENYYLYHAVLGQIQLAAGRTPEAAEALRRALALAPQRAERSLLAQRLATAEAQILAGSSL